MTLIDIYNNPPKLVKIGKTSYTFLKKDIEDEYVEYVNDNNDLLGFKLYREMKRIEYDPPDDFKEVCNFTMYKKTSVPYSRELEKTPINRQWEFEIDETLEDINEWIVDWAKQIHSEIDNSMAVVKMDNKERKEKINLLKGFL